MFATKRKAEKSFVGCVLNAPKPMGCGHKHRTYANKPRNRVSHQDKMAKPRVLVQKPGFCVSPETVGFNI